VVVEVINPDPARIASYRVNNLELNRLMNEMDLKLLFRAEKIFRAEKNMNRYYRALQVFLHL
jgi:hypothetical protein